MRIIGGEARRTVLRTPRDSRTRPTADRVREAVFSILGPLDGAPRGPRVLDLFAGTGALGIEAVSRGASSALLVERAPECAALCRANAERARLADRITVREAEVGRALVALQRAGDRFDWVFCDPPYATGDLDATLRRLGTGTLLAPDGVVVAEHSPRSRPADRYGALALVDRRRWGDTEVSFYRA
jgi:16S rRNA (guanine(966)-N(2))-methyltransferase RsmD